MLINSLVLYPDNYFNHNYSPDMKNSVDLTLCMRTVQILLAKKFSHNTIWKTQNEPFGQPNERRDI